MSTTIAALLTLACTSAAALAAAQPACPTSHLERGFGAASYRPLSSVAALPPELGEYFAQDADLGLAEAGGDFDPACATGKPQRRLLGAGVDESTAFALYEQCGPEPAVRLVIVAVNGPHRGVFAAYKMPPSDRTLDAARAAFAGSPRPAAYHCRPLTPPDAK